MLNRAKLLQALEHISDKLFVDFSDEYLKARHLWEQIAHDPLFVHKIKPFQTAGQAPSWHGTLNDTVSLLPFSDPYRAFAVDGSQIYPDRHQGTSCFLVNIGTVILSYGFSEKGVSLASTPTVFLEEQEESFFSHSTELVNCRREEFEFRAGLEQGALLKQAHPESPLLFLFDGSLIFWHLDTKEIEIKQTFLSCYIALLHQMYELNLLMAGYISLPKSKELASLIRIALSNFSEEEAYTNKEVEHVNDAVIASFFLKPASRSIVFENNAPISQLYPNHLRPHFFYVDVDTEIARVEIPGWIARDQALVNMVARIIIDQSIKGHGYPVALSEAHEQAVVKGPDREFFYHLITKMGLNQKKYRTVSQKSLKKRGIGI
jgi:hypothetical protein